MKIIKNERLIERNRKFGSWASISALAVLGLGMYISFTRTDLFAYSLIALLLGFTLTQLGMYLGNRYGRSPRPDEKLDAGLKGLPNEFAIHHYTTPAPHVVVGPGGVWVLKPYHQRGQVTFSKNRWRLSGGGFMQAYMRLFGQESLGRPDLEIDNEIASLRKFLAKQADGAEVPEIRAMLVFTSDEVEIDADEAPVPTLKLKQLKDFMRQRAKEKLLPAGDLALVRTWLDTERAGS